MAEQELQENTLEKFHLKSQSKSSDKYKVILARWKPGMKKVSVTMRIREEIGSLPDAKECTDRLLEGDEVILFTNSKTNAEKLAEELGALGVYCRVEKQEQL